MSKSSTRDAIRAATLGQSSKFESEVVNYNGVDVEIRRPSYKARQKLYTTTMDESGKVDMWDFMAYGVIFNTYVPGTNELVFDETDYDVMVAKPAGGFLDKFGEVATKLFNVAEDQEKNSESSVKTQKK